MLVSWWVSLIRLVFLFRFARMKLKKFGIGLWKEILQKVAHISNLDSMKKPWSCLDCNWDFHMQCWESVQLESLALSFGALNSLDCIDGFFDPLQGFIQS